MGRLKMDGASAAEPKTPALTVDLPRSLPGATILAGIPLPFPPGARKMEDEARRIISGLRDARDAIEGKVAALLDPKTPQNASPTTVGLNKLLRAALNSPQRDLVKDVVESVRNEAVGQLQHCVNSVLAEARNKTLSARQVAESFGTVLTVLDEERTSFIVRDYYLYFFCSCILEPPPPPLLLPACA
jgi:hypothetical protein